MSLKKSLEKLKAAMQNSMNGNNQPLLHMLPLTPNSALPPRSPTGQIPFPRPKECPPLKCYSTVGTTCMEITTYYQYSSVANSCIVSNVNIYKVSDTPCEQASVTPLCGSL